MTINTVKNNPPSFGCIKKSSLNYLSKPSKNKLKQQMKCIKNFARANNSYAFSIKPPTIEGNLKNKVQLSARKAGLKGLFMSIFKVPPSDRVFDLTEERRITDVLTLLMQDYAQRLAKSGK